MAFCRLVAKKRTMAFHFQTVSNFRALISNDDDKVVVYRSARQEKISLKETEDFLKLEIRTIIDLRGPVEYNDGNGTKLLDSVYKHYLAQVPSYGANMDEIVRVKPMNVNALESASPVSPSAPKRILVPISSRSYFRFFFAIKTLGLGACLCYLFLDLLSLFRFRFLKKAVVEQLAVKGLAWFYTFTLKYGGASLCAALKLLTVRENLPALVNCFYGKDRTGLVSALALHVMDESLDAIRADYLASHEGLATSREEDLKDSAVYNLPDCFHETKVENINVAWQFLLENYGSIDGYLDAIGFNEKWRLKLKQNFS